MSTLASLMAKHGECDRERLERLHQLIADWQVIADLAFADLVLWLPRGDGEFLAVAHVRSSTGPTVHHEDIVEALAPGHVRPLLVEAFDNCRIERSSEPRWFGAMAVREEAVPVVHEGDAIAVLTRQTNLGAVRTLSRVELNYVEAADELCEMVARGEYPFPLAPGATRRGAPRVGDGFIRLGADGEVLYASPNALSCFHRLGVHGIIVGKFLLEELSVLRSKQLGGDEATPMVLTGRAAWRTELELNGVCVSARAIPLLECGERIGAVLLCRDVSELRRRERELVTKDATIREINHRVKNNLQTVSALLRMQARRMSTDEARAALEEAQRRVTTIAMVHEALSSTFDETVVFDELVDRILRMTAEVATADARVITIRKGSFGLVPARDATPLALVLTELVSNAVEHGIGAGKAGMVQIVATRTGRQVQVDVIDDGVGIAGVELRGLGTSIVKTLVDNELHGDIQWEPGADGGTQVSVRLNVHD